MTDLVVGIEATRERIGVVACTLGGLPGGWVILPGLDGSPVVDLIYRGAATAIRQARRNLGPLRVRAIFVALDTPSDGAGAGGAAGAELRATLSPLLDDGGSLGVGDTLTAAFEAAAGGGWGILLEAGRRSAAFGRSPDGRTARIGGRSAWLDEANTLDVGRRAVQAAVRHLEQRGPATALTGLLWARWGPLPEGTESLPKPEALPSLFALAARTTVEAAERGDRVAQEILREAANTLAGLARAAASRLRWPEGQAVPLYPTAELLHSPLTVEYLKACLARPPAGPPFQVQPPLLAPSAGAVLAAARLAGADVRRTAERLAPHLLGAGLYGL